MNHSSNTTTPLHEDHLSIVTVTGRSVNYSSNTTTPLHEDHLSIVTATGRSVNHSSNTISPLHEDHLSIVTATGWTVNHSSNNTTPLHEDHLSIVTATGWTVNHSSNNTTPLHEDHLSIVTAIGWSMKHSSNNTTPLHEDNLSIKTMTTWPLEWSLLYRSLCTGHLASFQIDCYRQVAGYVYAITPVHMCTHKLCCSTGTEQVTDYSPREDREHVQKSRLPTSEYQSSIHRICWRIPETNRQKSRTDKTHRSEEYCTLRNVHKKSFKNCLISGEVDIIKNNKNIFTSFYCTSTLSIETIIHKTVYN